MSQPEQVSRKDKRNLHLTYEEYVHASVYIGCRIAAWTQDNLPAIDSVMVGWYVKEVLRTPSTSPDYQSKSSAIMGAVEKMIFDDLIKVVGEHSAKNMRIRCLELNPEFFPEAYLTKMIENHTHLSGDASPLPYEARDKRAILPVGSHGVLGFRPS
eukprot:Selendium_serpulae@DN6244_c0_g1_i13.p1